MADRSGSSPAFTPPTPSMNPDEQIIEVNLKATEWGARPSQLSRDAKNEMPLKHIGNGN